MYRGFNIKYPSKEKLSAVDIIIICSDVYHEEIDNQLKLIFDGKVIKAIDLFKETL